MRNSRSFYKQHKSPDDKCEKSFLDMTMNEFRDDKREYEKKAKEQRDFMKKIRMA